MTNATPKLAHGTILQMGDGASPEVFSAIGSLIGDVTSSESVEVAKAYPHDVTAYIKKAAGYDPGTLSFGMLYDSAATAHAAVQTAMRAQTQKNFKWINVDTGAEQDAFSGFITKWDKVAPEKDFMRASVTIERSGAIIST